MSLDYKIISSGSSGNCVIIENMMVDCGVSYRTIKDYLYDIKFLILTHIHSDHINKLTLKSIKREFPKIKTFGNYQVYQHHTVDVIIGDSPVPCGNNILEPFELVHDVVTHGFTMEINGHRIIYATDTSSLVNAPKYEYDYFFIESNHDEQKLRLATQAVTRGYNPLRDSSRHLSTQQAKAFYYQHRKSQRSEFIELHKSSRFY